MKATDKLLPDLVTLLSGALIAGSLALGGCKLFGGQTEPVSEEPAQDSTYTLSLGTTNDFLRIDSSYTLSWNAPHFIQGDSLRLELLQNSSRLFSRLIFDPAAGKWTFDLADWIRRSGYRFGSGAGYRLRLLTLQPNSNASSDTLLSPIFDLVSGYYGAFRVIEPDSATQAHPDSTLKILWDLSGSVGNKTGLQLYRDTAMVATLTLSASDSAAYAWKVPNGIDTGSQYRIRVFAPVDPSITAMSAPFQIVIPTAPMDTQPQPTRPSLAFTFPGLGDSVLAKVRVSLAWAYSSTAADTARLDLFRGNLHVSLIDSQVYLAKSPYPWTVDSTLPTGQYRFRLMSHADSQVVAFSPDFTLIHPTPIDTLPPDSLPPRKVWPMDTVSHTRNLPNSTPDSLFFHADKGRWVIAHLKAPSNLLVSLYDSLGLVQVAQRTGKDLEFIFNPPASGLFFLKVITLQGKVDYSFSLQAIDSSQRAARTRFIAPTQDTLWEGGKPYSIQWTPDTVFFGSRVRLELFLDSTRTSYISTSALNNGAFAFYPSVYWSSSTHYRIRLTSTTDTSVYTFSPAFTIKAIDADAYEPDNELALAKPFRLGDTAATHSLYAGDADWMRFPCVQLRTILVEIESRDSTFSGTLTATFYDSLGNAVSTKSGSGPFFAVYTPTRTAPYFLRVTASTYIHGYSVRISEVDPVTGVLPTYVLSPDSNSQWKTGELDTIRWSTEKAYPGSPVYLALMRDSSLVTTISSSIYNVNQWAWSLPSWLPTSSRYRIRVASSYSGVFAYSSYFTINGPPDDAYEPDNSVAQAKVISTGETQNRKANFSDTDFVRIQASPDSLYVLTLNSKYSTTVWVTDSAGNALRSASGLRLNLPLQSSKAQPFFLHVKASLDTLITDYQLSLYAYGRDVHGVHIPFTSPDSLSIWTAGLSQSITWERDTLLFPGYASLSLYRDTTLAYSQGSYVGNLGSATITPPAGFISDNTYRLRLTRTDFSDIFATSPPFTISGVRADSLEPNESATQASALKANGAPLPLSLTYLDQDWFSFAGKNRRVYQIRSHQSPSMQQNFSIWKPSATSAEVTTNQTLSDSNHILSWFCNADGPYLFSIRPYSTSSYNFGAYQLEFRELDSSAYAFEITSPTKDSVALLGRAYSIRWNDPGEIKGSVDLFLYDSVGIVQTIYSSTTNNGALNWSVPATLPPRKDYFIRVVSKLNAAIYGISETFEIAVP